MAPSQPAYVYRIPHAQLRHDNCDSLRNDVLAVLESGHRRIVLDFSAVEFVDSAALGMMVMVLKRLVTNGGELKVASLNPGVRQTFRIMRFHQVFDIHESPESAAAAFTYN